MAKIMTLRVKVYTIAELKEANYSAYEKVINKAAQNVMEWDGEFINESLTDSLTEYAAEQGYGIDKRRGGKGSSLNWDNGRGAYVAWDGQVFLEVLLPRYCAEQKIPPATRTMLLNMVKRGALSVYIRKGTTWYQSEYGKALIDYDEGDTDGDDPRMIARREAAVHAFGEWLSDDLLDMEAKMLRMINDEYDYRTSEEVLAEEIDMNERVFTIDGDDTVWVGRIPEEDENA